MRQGKATHSAGSSPSTLIIASPRPPRRRRPPRVPRRRHRRRMPCQCLCRRRCPCPASVFLLRDRTFQMAEVAIPRSLFRTILRRIRSEDSPHQHWHRDDGFTTPQTEVARLDLLDRYAQGLPKSSQRGGWTGAWARSSLRERLWRMERIATQANRG